MRGISLQLFRFASVIFCLILAACGSGGGGGDGDADVPAGTSFSLSTNNLSFVAEAPGVSLVPQPLTGTVRGTISGTLYIKIVASGAAISWVSSVTYNSSDSGTVYIYPGNPRVLGVGSHSGTITVTACLNDPTCATGQLPGSPQTVAVTLLVKSSVHADTVMPHVATENQSGNVVIRGTGFVRDNVSRVTFGAIDAVSFAIVSDTEIHATYPALAAGTYAVSLANASSLVPFTGELAVIAPGSYSAGTLQYPQAPHQTLALEYDAEREALLVGASYFDGYNFNTASREGNQILRYQFVNGTFSSLTTKNIPLLQDMTLSPDGRQLIVITDKEVIHLDPVTLAEVRRATMPQDVSYYYLKDIIVMNDGNALITTGLSGSGSTTTYLYPLSQPGFHATIHSCTYFASPGVSADGTLGVFIQGGLSPTPPLCAYESVSGLFTVLPIFTNQTQCMNSYLGTCRPPSLDASGSRIAVINVLFTVSIYDRHYTLLGHLPGMFGVAAFSPDGTRAYAYESNGILRTFDMTANAVNGQFQEIGSGTTLAGNPGSAVDNHSLLPYGVVKMTVSPDGGTLFLAGANQVVIQPVP